MLSTAIINLRPNAEFATKDGKIIWMDKKQKEPTEEEINSEILRLEKEFAINSRKEELNKERDKKLSGFVIDNIFVNESIVKTMAVTYSITEDGEFVDWIDVDNNKIQLSKQQLATIIKSATNTIKAIYFEYRSLKDVSE